MSANDILAELPKLDSAELYAVFAESAALLDRREISASPELLAAIEEAEQSYALKGGVSLEEMRRRLGS